MAMPQIELSVRRMMMDCHTTITHLDPDEAGYRLREFQVGQDGNLGPPVSPELQIRKSPHHQSRHNAQQDATQFNYSSG
jgi:hypothetical protein